MVTPLRGLFKVSELYRDNKIKSNSVKAKDDYQIALGTFNVKTDIKEILKGINL